MLKDSLLPADGSGKEYANVNWTAQVYVYVTGAQPSDPNFTASGGMVYVVIVSDGGCVVNQAAGPWEVLDLSIVPNLLTGTAQLPSSGQNGQDENEFKYAIEFKQTFSMFNNGGNGAFSHNAEYQQDWTRMNLKQTGVVENGACRMRMARSPKDADITGTQQIAGCAVFRINRIPTSPVIVGCVASLQGPNVTANMARSSFQLSLDFST
ncbi:hypothetical protein ONZ45_g3186 [Pleurotus djamor]|nr:hypothetical protein ONZ45_g3186 [Pleurotus djamor]